MENTELDVLKQELQAAKDTLNYFIRTWDYLLEHEYGDKGYRRINRTTVEMWKKSAEKAFDQCKSEGEVGLSKEVAYWVKRKVGDWLRIKGQWEHKTAPRVHDNPPLLMQLGADADHSSLLLRLLEGKDPLPEPPPVTHAYPDYQRVEGKEYKWFPKGWIVEEDDQKVVILKYAGCPECHHREGKLLVRYSMSVVGIECMRCEEAFTVNLEPGEGDGD